MVYGGSMGSNYAPLVAAGENGGRRGGVGRRSTHLVRANAALRKKRARAGGTDPQALAGEVNARAAYFARYLLKGESPGAIAASDPELGKVWQRIVGTSADAHYGRPFAFHQQAQRQNWAGAWARVRAPVFVLYGGYDWFESRDAAMVIASIVNAQKPGSAMFRELPQLDHHFTRYPSATDAFHEKNGTTDAAPAVDAILQWLAQVGMRK